MTDTLIANLLRFFGLLVLQVGIFQTQNFEYFDIHVYIVFILLLPNNLLPALVVAASFVMGLSVDVFQNTAGLCAATATAVAAIRFPILTFLEPRGSYNSIQPLTKKALGAFWFMQYSTIIVLIHSILYALLEDLSFSWFWLFRTFLIFVSSLLVVNVYQYIFNPKI
jgi:hypothetical protein